MILYSVVYILNISSLRYFMLFLLIPNSDIDTGKFRYESSKHLWISVKICCPLNRNFLRHGIKRSVKFSGKSAKLAIHLWMKMWEGRIRDMLVIGAWNRYNHCNVLRALCIIIWLLIILKIFTFVKFISRHCGMAGKIPAFLPGSPGSNPGGVRDFKLYSGTR